jgi:hypothetical protein
LVTLDARVFLIEARVCILLITAFLYSFNYAVLPLRTSLIDFNSYSDSLHEQIYPALRGKSAEILPVMAEISCCVADSDEAKRIGVKTGTAVCEARKLQLGIIIAGVSRGVFALTTPGRGRGCGRAHGAIAPGDDYWRDDVRAAQALARARRPQRLPLE